MRGYLTTDIISSEKRTASQVKIYVQGEISEYILAPIGSYRVCY